MEEPAEASQPAIWCGTNVTMRRIAAAVIFSVAIGGACSESGDETRTAKPPASSTTASRSDPSTTRTPTSTTDGEAPPVLTVTPTTGSASAETVLAVTGTGCQRGAIFWLSESGAELEGAQAATADGDGNWKGTLNIDSTDSPSGSYEVIADCYAEPGRVAFRYSAVAIEVLP